MSIEENVFLLPVKKPVTAAYTTDAHIVSILGSYDYAEDWIMSQYILIFCRKDLKKHCWGDYYFPMTYNVRSQESCRYLQKQKIHPDTLQNFDIDIIEFVFREIQNRNYVDIMLDPYYLTKTFCYHTEHGYHDILIYGFNKKERVFYCGDFLFSDTGSYAFSEISFEDFIKAYKNCNPNAPENYQGGLIYMYKVLDKKSSNYVFNFQNIIHSLRAYYECRQLENWEFYHSDDASMVVFGLEVYDEMRNYLEEMKKNDEKWINIRMFQFIFNHKSIMNERITYLKIRYPELDDLWNPLLENYQNIQDICNAMVLSIIKSYLSNKKVMIDGITKLLKKAQDMERTALKEFFNVYDIRYFNQEIH